MVMLRPDHSDFLSLKRALIWILSSALLFSGTGLIIWLIYFHQLKQKFNDPHYQIIAIMQETVTPESLQTNYLAELLDLSLDRPTNLYQFDLTIAAQRLRASPLIKQAQIKKIRPGTLFIKYQMRKPHLFLEDLTNTAMDEEGFLFPFAPFFTPKKLPTVYLGWNSAHYQRGMTIKNDAQMKLAMELLDLVDKRFPNRSLRVKRLDLSKSDEERIGRREIVMELIHENEAGTNVYLIRMNPKKYFDNLQSFIALYDYLNNNPGLYQGSSLVIDLRSSSFAFIKRVKDV